MTANSVTEPAATSVAPQGQSQWRLIWREFRKRRLALAASATIVFLVTTSIFAPVLANSLPIYYYGINRFEYQEASRTLRATVSQLIEARAADKPIGEIQRFCKTLTLQIEIMSGDLSKEKRQALRTLGKQMLAAANSADLPNSNEELKQLQREIRASYESKEVNLQSRLHLPVLASLNGLDLGFMTANFLFWISPVWIYLLRFVLPADRDQLRRLCLGTVLIGLPLLVGGCWWWFVPVRIDRTDYKKGVYATDPDSAKATVLFESVIWPPIVYGLDEYDLAGKSQPPPWYPDNWCPTGKNTSAAKAISSWSGSHWLGTDESGRDLLCRMIWGGRVSLSVGLVAVAIYVSIGIVVGAIAGYFRGIPDLIISRLIEVMICFPTFFLILTIVAFFGPSILNIMLILGLTGWTGIARLVRGEFLRLVDQEFVLASRALGYSSTRIIFRHVLPNAMAPVLVSATFGIAGAILTESALSFLGLGVSKPTPSWGALLFEGREALQRAPWLIHFPGLAIFITITAYNLIGEALRDASDPRLRGSR